MMSNHAHHQQYQLQFAEQSLGLQTRFPQVEAVSCGAILSNYQRLRVENVYVCMCVQLWLWRPNLVCLEGTL